MAGKRRREREGGRGGGTEREREREREGGGEGETTVAIYMVDIQQDHINQEFQANQEQLGRSKYFHKRTSLSELTSDQTSIYAYLVLLPGIKCTHTYIRVCAFVTQYF